MFARPLSRRVIVGTSLVLALMAPSLQAGPLRERAAQHALEAQSANALDTDTDVGGAAARLPAGLRVLRDVAYGSDAKQALDAYIPAQAKAAPVIVMVHGGAWRLGDKRARGVVENKVAHWLPAGYVFVSVNYRMLPNTPPLAQAQDVARALAFAQKQAGAWGADPRRFILMGHSAGAHLVALLNAQPKLAVDLGAQPWMGAVALDSAALDVVQIMEAKHLRLYDQAFGANPSMWPAVSPYHLLTQAQRPILLVCSSRRAVSCAQARRFADKARSFSMQARVLEQDLSHADINHRLGEDASYTRAVDEFLRTLAP